MAPNCTPEANSTESELVPSKGDKRKRDGTSDPQSSSVRKRKNGAVGVPSKQTDCQKALEGAKIVKEFRITFHPQKFSPQRPGNVPEEHQTKFKHIQQLGKISYDSYAVQPRPDTANKPWEDKNKERATLVSEKAVQAMKDYQNEDGWRMKLEPFIFERFEIEVACQECRKRLWQSLVEVNPEESNSRTKNLAERQHRRTVCDCEPSSKQNGILSTGRTNIFSERIGERSIIQDDPENHHGKEMKPDRVYGLRTTDSIENIWQQPHTSHFGHASELEFDSLGSLTKSCNPDSGGEATIYPFLVMEAKSLKSRKNFLDIETQTAIPIRNQLLLQHKLQKHDFNKMPTPGGPLSWFLAYVGETWRVYGCFITKSSSNNLPCYDVVRLWQGDITGYDEALQLVLIMDYIVDWARDIFRPSIIRQLMSVVDKGKESSYTMVEGHDILSIRDYANSSYGDRPIPNIGEAGTFEAPTQPDFDAVSSTTGSSFEPLFESTGKHVDIRVWEAAKYESRVRGIFITENDTAATEHHIHKDYQRLWTVDVGRYWFFLPNAQGIKILEEAWTGSQNIKDMQDVQQQRILISLYVQYRKDVDGAPIRELTYLAVTETAARYMLEEIELVVPAEEVGIKLREAWASSDKNYFQRYAKGQTGVLCVTASDYDKSVDRVVLGFYSGREMTNHARRLDSFFKSTCKDRQAELYKIYATCSRYTKVVHSLTVEPHCVLDPTQDCVFVNIDAMQSGIYAYVTNAASEMISRTSMIRHLVQMVAVLWDNTSLNISSSFSTNDESRIASKILLWIVSDPQWDLYDTMKSNLTGMDKVHNRLAWYRKVLLRHECGTGTVGSEHGHSTIETECIKEGHKNIQRYIQRACKKCDFKHYADPASSGPTFSFCDEDFMPEDGF
ncbi:hypothetical protein AG0111_0g4835 [Alternaria gaisen]|uniref:Uncharacterized protein n=1 Tax=Alternaria gaisen TaxID=167740 RepID=A0ACB6FRE6_9PLEO|nr:hypothetical protein AG0111_0g4835 [Alternaria gaisen]